jgi:hypothetical protein
MKFLPILRLSQLQPDSRHHGTSSRDSIYDLRKRNSNQLDQAPKDSSWSCSTFAFLLFFPFKIAKHLAQAQLHQDDPSLPSSPECESSTSISAANIQEIIKLRALVEAVLGQMPGCRFTCGNGSSRHPKILLGEHSQIDQLDSARLFMSRSIVLVHPPTGVRISEQRRPHILVLTKPQVPKFWPSPCCLIVQNLGPKSHRTGWKWRVTHYIPSIIQWIQWDAGPSHLWWWETLALSFLTVASCAKSDGSWCFWVG